MEHDFWHQKWHKNEIGFHLSAPNPLLLQHFSRLNLSQSARVFLPLCGKALDIAWLLAQGYRVVGVELSELAIKDLFSGLNLVPTITHNGEISHYSGANIDILVGDIFKVTQSMLGEVQAVYDRAALVALPDEMRLVYCTHLMALSNLAPQLLVCVDYDQATHQGPPFSVNAAEVMRHYQASYQLTLLASECVPNGLKGQYPATEHVWWLNPLK